ncbi:uncharacterized protein METZ01_LOCUS229598, partial [marine metagenome]
IFRTVSWPLLVQSGRVAGTGHATDCCVCSGMLWDSS